MKTQQISRNYNEYLLNAIDSEGYDVEISTNEDKVKFLADCFQKEFSHEIKRNGGLPENATSKQEDRITDNYYNCIAVKITQLCKKYKVTLY